MSENINPTEALIAALAALSHDELAANPTRKDCGWGNPRKPRPS